MYKIIYIHKMIFKVIFFILAYSASEATSLEVPCTLYKLNYPANLTNEGTIKFGVYGKIFIKYIVKVNGFLKYGSEEKGSSLCRCSILLGFIMSKNLRGL